jgi:hypothetical protein
LLGVQEQGPEADNSPLVHAPVKNGGAITALPHTSSWRGVQLIKHRHEFTFLCFMKQKKRDDFKRKRKSNSKVKTHQINYFGEINICVSVLLVSLFILF